MSEECGTCGRLIGRQQKFCSPECYHESRHRFGTPEAREKLQAAADNYRTSLDITEIHRRELYEAIRESGMGLGAISAITKLSRQRISQIKGPATALRALAARLRETGGG